MQNNLEELRLKFATQYPEYFGAKAGALSFGYLTNEGAVKWFPNNGCHGSIRAANLGSAGALYSSLWCRYPDLYPAALDYWEYLTKDPAGPWSKYLKNVNWLYNDDGKPVAVGTSDMSNLVNVIVPMFIQCRVPQEMSNKLRSYWSWRQAGFTRAESMYLSEYIAVHVNGALSLINETYTHMFDINLKGIDYKRLEESNPNLTGFLTETLLTHGGLYSQVCKSWALPFTERKYCPDYDSVKAAAKKNLFAKLLAGKPSYNGLFEKLFESNKEDFVKDMPTLISKHEAITILTNSKKEWKS